MLTFLLVVFVYALIAHLAVMDSWLQRPYLLVFPVVGVAAIARLANAPAQNQRPGARRAEFTSAL